MHNSEVQCGCTQERTVAAVAVGAAVPGGGGGVPLRVRYLESAGGVERKQCGEEEWQEGGEAERRHLGRGV